MQVSANRTSGTWAPARKGRWHDGLGLVGWIALCFAAAAVGSLLTETTVGGWYQQLAKPAWNPPDWVFGPVWTLLYGMMGVAAWLVWRQRGFSDAVLPLSLFGVQLALNVAWSGLFFSLRSPGLAFAEILLLWCAILATLVAFWRVRAAAGALLVPYLLWVSYAATLNFAIWRLN